MCISSGISVSPFILLWLLQTPLPWKIHSPTRWPPSRLHNRKHNGLTVSSPCPQDLCWQGAYLSNSPSGHSLNFIITFTQRPHSPLPAPVQGLTTAGTLRQGHSWKIGDWQVLLAPHQPKIHPPNFPSFFLSFTRSDLHCDLRVLPGASLCPFTGASSTKALVCRLQHGICISEDPPWTAALLLLFLSPDCSWVHVADLGVPVSNFSINAPDQSTYSTHSPTPRPKLGVWWNAFPHFQHFSLQASI